MPNPTLQDALALYSLTNDPLLLDSIRVLANPKLTDSDNMAAANVLACKQAYLTLYGNSDYHPLDGKLSRTDDSG
jgi:hypothetical protein